MKEKLPDKALKVLITDDDENYRNLIKIAFEEAKSPCQLEFVFDGASLVESLNNMLVTKSNFPDLILLDLNMPKKKRGGYS